MPALLKFLAKFLAIFLAIYLILFFIFSTPTLEKATNTFYSNTHGKVLNFLLPKVGLRFIPETATPTDWKRVTAEFHNKEERNRQLAEARAKGVQKIMSQATMQSVQLNVIFTSFLIFLVALILATPIPWKPKLYALLWGNVLFFLFLVFKMYFKLLFLISEAQIGVYELEGFSKKVVFYLSDIMVAGFSAMMVLLIWAVVIFNKKNIIHIKNKLGLT